MRRIKIYTHEPICCICLYVINDNSNFLRLSCKHIYHANCLYQWKEHCIHNYTNKVICPLCKKIIKIK